MAALLVELFFSFLFALAFDFVPNLIAIEVAGAVFVIKLTLEGGAFEIRDHVLEHVAGEAGGFVVDGAVYDGVDELSEGVVDSVGIFHVAEIDLGDRSGVDRHAAEREVDVGLTVVMAVIVVAERGRSAARSVRLDVIAATDIASEYGHVVPPKMILYSWGSPPR